MSRLSLVVVCLCVCTMTACSQSITQKNDSLHIVASFYPLGYIAERIAGDTATVTTIIPGGIEPHDYEPTPSQLVTMEDADILHMNGAGLDPWAERMRPTVEKKGAAVIVATDGIPLLPAMHDDHHDEEGADEGHAADLHDPHVWLDPVQMRSIATRLADAMIAASPAHAEAIASNTQGLLQDLDALDTMLRTSLRDCERRTAIVSHDAFRYLARRYNFTTIAIAGIEPDSEPSTQTLGTIIETVRRERIPFVFFETLVSPKLAETVAREAGAATLILQPVEGLTPAEQEEGKDYLSIMQQNARNLSLAFGCTQ